MIDIRPAQPGDHAGILACVLPVIRAGETYAVDRDLDEGALLAWWCGADRQTFVAADDATGAILGSCYVKANAAGGGAHVANAGFVTHGAAGGRGVARTMALAMLDAARAAGFVAMQFNCVVSSNTRAVALWRGLGFAEVGRLPGAFRHPHLGEIDALVMYRRL